VIATAEVRQRPSLEALASKWGTDKGTTHSYIGVYEEVLGPFRDEEIHLLEIGAGWSTPMWLEFFPNGSIYVIDREIPKELKHERLWTFQMHQEDEQELYRFKDLRFDVIIDDGSHEPWRQLMTCHALWRCLKPGGFYFVEDIPGSNRIHYWSMMPGFTCWEFLKDGRGDDILVAMRKEST
jgi:hypothetical protein